MSARRSRSSRSLRDFADQPHSKARAGKWLSHHELAIEAQILSDAPHFVLEQVAERLDEAKIHPLRQTADIVVALDHDGRAMHRCRLDDIRVERALRQEIEAPQLLRALSRTHR